MDYRALRAEFLILELIMRAEKSLHSVDCEKISGDPSAYTEHLQYLS